MTATEIAENIIRGVNAGQFTSDQKVDSQYVFDNLPTWRQEAIKLIYNGSRTLGANKYLSEDNYQDKQYTIVASEQDASLDYLVVDSCGVISINSQIDGLQYCGSTKQVNNFFRAKNRNEVQQLKDLGFFGVKPIVVAEGERRLIYGFPNLKTFFERSIFTNPYFHDANFNYDTSKFPVSTDVAFLIKEIAVAQIGKEFRLAKDVTADSGNLEQTQIQQATI
jgi:hypothetical protein